MVNAIKFCKLAPDHETEEYQELYKLANRLREKLSYPPETPK